MNNYEVAAHSHSAHLSSIVTTKFEVVVVPYKRRKEDDELFLRIQKLAFNHDPKGSKTHISENAQIEWFHMKRKYDWMGRHLKFEDVSKQR